MNNVSNIVSRMTTDKQEPNFRIQSSTESLPNISLVSYLQPADGISRVTLRVIGKEEPTAQGVAVAAGQLFGANARIVPGTARLVDRGVGGVYTVTASLTRNEVKVVVPDAKKVPENFRCVAKNIFLDDRDDLTWTMVESDAGNYLVRDALVETDSDLQTLLTSCSGATHTYTSEYKQMAASVQIEASKVETGSMLSFVGSKGDHELAFVVVPKKDDRIGVLAAGAVELDYILPSSIVASFDSAGLEGQVKLPEINEVTLAGGAPSIDTMVDYYKKIYGMNDAFFKEWSSRIKSHTFA